MRFVSTLQQVCSTSMATGNKADTQWEVCVGDEVSV